MLHLMAKGASNAEIARLLSLSPKTVANYVSNILHRGGAPGVAKKRFIRSLPVRTVRWEVRTTHHAPRRHPSRDPLHALATPSMGRHTAEGMDGASG